MRTMDLWSMGFVAAAALSFCLPDFVVFRFTQAVIWSIALMGLVLLCGISGQFSFAQAALFGIGGYGLPQHHAARDDLARDRGKDAQTVEAPSPATCR